MAEQSILGDVGDLLTELELYNCNGDGICFRSLGYIKDGKADTPNYISISKTDSTQNKLSSEDEENFVVNCDNEESTGKVKSDDKYLCLGLNTAAIQFPSADNHYIVNNGSKYLIIRTTSNGIITEEEIEGKIF